MKLDQTIERAKREICKDVANGHVPATVGSFSELHDYVDANYYGGAFEEWYEGAPSEDAFVNFWNTVQDNLDNWIKSGGLRRADRGAKTS